MMHMMLGWGVATAQQCSTASRQSLLAAPSRASRCGRFWALASSSGLRRVNNHKMILATVVVSTKLETKA